MMDMKMKAKMAKMSPEELRAHMASPEMAKHRAENHSDTLGDRGMMTDGHVCEECKESRDAANEGAAAYGKPPTRTPRGSYIKK